MNLIQLQDHLKDVPLQKVMEYANGADPQCPAYLALGEMQRRKRMEEAYSKGAPPQETVKDEIESSFKQPEQSGPQGMAPAAPGQAEAPPQAAPEAPQGVPPMPQMASGGIVSLPVSFDFADGGIVSFNKGSEDKPVKEDKEEKESEMMRAIMTPIRALAGVYNKPVDVTEEYSDPMGSSIPTAINNAAVGGRPPAKILPPATPVPDTPPPEAAPKQTLTQSFAPSAGGRTGIASEIPSYFKTAADQYRNQQFVRQPDYEAGLKAAIAANPAMQGNANQKYEELIDQIQKQDMANRGKLDEQEQARARADLWRALADAGEASRGTKGIGGSMAGLAQSLTGSQALSQERAAKRMEAERNMSLNYAKSKAEIENARRAEARGDYEAAFKHKAEAAKYENEYNKDRLAGAVSLGTLEEHIRNTNLSHADRQASLAQSRIPPVMQLAGKLQSTDKNLSDDEALHKAAAILSNSAYLNAEQRAQAASSKQLEAILAPLNMQLGFTQDTKEQQKIIDQMNILQQQFLDRQAKLKGGIASVPTQGSSAISKYKVEKES
jgi:hypothetical protein